MAPRRARVLELWRAGATPRQIAVVMGVSTQRVYQHLRRARELGELEDGGEG